MIRAWLLFTLLFFSIGSLQGQTMKVCYEIVEQKPLTLGAGYEIPENPGVLAELVILAAKDAGIDVSFYRRPWKRCIQDIAYHKADATFAAIWTPERDNWARYPKMTDNTLDRDRYLWRVTYPVYVRKGSRVEWDGQRFSGVTLGIGAPPGYIAQQKLAKMKVLSSKNTIPQKGMVLVALGRMDGYVVAQSAGREIIEKFELGDSVKTLPLPFMQSLLYLPLSNAFYKKHPQIAEKLWSSLAKVRKQQGERLLKKYDNL